MNVTKRKNLYQLAFMPRLFPVNCYLIEEEASLTLIDAAFAHNANSILRTAAEIGKPIKRILLTHAHADHVGALDKIISSNSGIELWVPKRDERLLNGDTSLDPGEPQKPIKGGVPRNLKAKADHLMSEGDRIGSLIAIDTPGHTPGSMSFLDARDRSIIAGDAFQTRGRVAAAGQLVPSFPFPAMGTWCKEMAVASAEKIKSLNPSLLAVGHGRMLESPNNELEEAIKAAGYK
ncbi:MBL fold metallo-hydrolase [Bacillus salacetis]|uniref:MBL fold metallo-hydrolase n=1 Tax=Bacillus salacetis TaxID=2315464 RepID=A0A3A1R0E8_9BACI|nr:MBL fold metallo-hydrolase [Bacillus salacetis]RIW33311.1 MBL fold metallo-hydrolase [Bacillus salacetis]